MKTDWPLILCYTGAILSGLLMGLGVAVLIYLVRHL